jgi:CheY-like chemotaxis protein
LKRSIIISFRIEAWNIQVSGGGDMRILVVDDMEIWHTLLKDLFDLQLPGAKIFNSMTGVEALDEIGKQGFDVVVTDYGMAGLNGLEFIRRAQRDYPGRVRCWIVMSSISHELSNDRLFKGGGASLLDKSDLTEKLVTLIMEKSPKRVPLMS